MDTKEIAALILSNIDQDVKKVQGQKDLLTMLIDDMISTNAKPIVDCADEKQLFAVISEILSSTISDAEILKLVDKYVPLVLKPFEGMVEGLVRPLVTAAILNGIDGLLNKYAGSDWFTKIQNRAKGVIGEFEAKNNATQSIS